MLSRKIPKLKLWSRLGLKCKGSSNTRDNIGNTSSNSNMVVTNNTTSFYKTFSIRSREFGKYALQGIPVLSIFALVGIMALTTGLPSFANTQQVHAIDTADDDSTSTALIIDSNSNSNIKDAVNATPETTTYISHNVQVKASDIESYNLTISSTGLQGNSAITGANGKKGNEMFNDTWGFGWDETSVNNETITYHTIGSTDTPTSITSGAPETNSIDFTKKLVFAAKFTNAESGHYTASINLNLIATPRKIINPFGVETMQEMTSTICDNAKENDTFRLTDSRDGKKYWVTRLWGGCWMTQNLDYNPSSGVTTNLDLSDYSSYTVSDPGEYVLLSPLNSAGCNNTKDINACSRLSNVADKTPSNNPSFNTNAQDVIQGNTYDAHYLIGNYYKQSVIDSVCPSGWSVASINTSSSNDLDWMLNTYGITDNVIAGSYDLRKAPFYMGYTGYSEYNGLVKIGNSTYYMGPGRANGGSTCGGYVGCTSVPIFTIIDTSVSKTGKGATGFGYPVRCRIETGNTSAGGAIS